MPEKLHGIQVFEYQHPADKAATDVVKKVPGFNKIGTVLEEFERNYQDDLKFWSTYVKLDKDNALRIVNLFKETCDILDYSCDCTLFSYHSYEYRISVGGIKAPIIKIPDLVLERFSDEQMRFLFGQMITMMKSNSLPMFALAKGVSNCTGIVPIIGDAIKMPIGQWYRKAQPTIDRGGLLACQNFDVAMRYLMLLAGIPYKECENINVYDYVEEISRNYDSKKSLAGTVGNLSLTVFSNRRAWANERIVELFNWYESGKYEQIIARHT